MLQVKAISLVSEYLQMQILLKFHIRKIKSRSKIHPQYTLARKPAAMVTVFFSKKISATFAAADRISIFEFVLPVFPMSGSRMVNGVWNLTSCGLGYWANMTI